MNQVMENPMIDAQQLALNRRMFLQAGSCSIGMAGLASLLQADDAQQPHFAPTAKRVIYLCQSGAPSQIDLFDHKPALERFRGQDLPDSIRKGQRLTGMTKDQTAFPIAPSIQVQTTRKFRSFGQ
jgi:hypothetical protein